MSNHQSPEQKSLSAADKLERQLAKIIAADKRKMRNENIVRRNENGDLTYETVRTFRVGQASRLPENPSAPDSDQPPEPNSYPQTPDLAQNGQQFGAAEPAAEPAGAVPTQPEVIAPDQLVASAPTDEPTADNLAAGGISIHDANPGGQKLAAEGDESADPLEELLARALSRPRRGRPAAFDEHNKGKLVALLSLGMSLRQAAAVLGVAHGTIRNTLKADPALAEEITAARFQAQLQPLACVIREARRSWKAATWLLKYLDGKIATHEETPDERRQRQQRESDEFLAHSRSR